MKPLLYVLLLFISSAWLQSQDGSTSPRPVVNADIVEMSRAGLLPAVLIAKIKNSQCKFDTSPSALVELKEAGVADDVLMEMVRNPTEVDHGKSKRLSRRGHPLAHPLNLKSKNALLTICPSTVISRRLESLGGCS
jgi:hypothetical protein